jgi:hypothetical protein
MIHDEIIKLSDDPEGTDMVLEEKPGRRKFAESGVIGDLTQMVIQVQNQVLDKRDIDLEQLQFMTQNDGQAKGILNAIKYPVRMARPKIKAAEGGEEEAEFIEQNLLKPPADGGMETSLRSVISRMALAVRDGHKIFEKVFHVREGKIHLKKLAYRTQETTKFRYDWHGDISGAEQKTTFQGKEIDTKWGLDKVAHFVYNSEENPFVGESDFFPVFYHYDKKHKLYAIAHIAYQLNAVPIRLGSHPKNMPTKDLKKFREALKALGTSVAMTFPEECEVNPFESKRGLEEFLALIQHHDSLMSRAFLTQFINLGQEGRGGSYALSSDQSNLFLMSIMSLLTDIAQVFNTQIIPQLIDWNFGTGNYPTLEFTPFSDTIRSAIMSTFNNMLMARFPQISPEFALRMEEGIAEELGLDLDYEAIKARIEEERAQLMEAEGSATDVEDEEGKGSVSKGEEETEKQLMSDFPEFFEGRLTRNNPFARVRV